MGFVGEHYNIWDQYLNYRYCVHSHHIEKDGTLIWTKNEVGGNCLPSLGYSVSRDEEDLPQPSWWNSTIWQLNYPLKTNIFSSRYERESPSLGQIY